MSLSSSQAKERIKQPLNHEKIQKGLKYQNKIRLFTQPYLKEELVDLDAFQDFLGCIKGILRNDEKFNNLQTFIDFPLQATNLSNDILGDLFKVFEGRNANFQVDAPNERTQQSVEQLLSSLNVVGKIEEKGKHSLKSSPNLIVVIDKDANGEPFLLFVENDKLIDYHEKNGVFSYIVFPHSMGRDDLGEFKKVAVYDTQYYRVFELRGDAISMVVENPHNLGYCPARFYWDRQLNDKNDFNRFNPIASTLGSMSEWQQFKFFKKYADSYNPFPVTEYPYQPCSDEHCNNGYISRPLYEGGNVTGYTKAVPCSVCSKSHFIGPGTSLGIEPKTDKDGIDTSGMFKMIVPETSNLEYINKKLATLEAFIKKNTVGVSDVMQNQAVNEVQIKGILEDRKKPLMFLKDQLDRLYKWIVKTSVKLRFDIEVNVHANFGTEFFLESLDDIKEQFAKAKKEGLPEDELESIYKMLIETKYKGNPHMIRRKMILNHLNPLPYDTMNEAIEKYKIGLVSLEDLQIKANFTKFVKDFERIENISIVEFGKDLPFEEKIEIVRNRFLEFIPKTNEQNNTEQLPTSR